MQLLFYNLFLWIYVTGIRIAAAWNPKAKLWIRGRRGIFRKLAETIPADDKIIWIHCSSLGEFEQGRPVLEQLRARYTHYKFLLTFFSPSGYEIRKNYAGADFVFYLPADSATHAKKFLEIVNPALAIFVKYDYWYHYLSQCKKRKIPLLMISAIFRQNQPFFKWYGGLHRKMLQCFTHFFVQDERSGELLKKISIQNVTITGDTRFDRVAEILRNSDAIEPIEKFCEGSKVLVAGSTWPADEKIIKEAGESIYNLKIIVAPHEISPSHLEQLKMLFPASLFFSKLAGGDKQPGAGNILIIDNIGMLSRLYRYGTITYVGGGFNRGIHNILEAAVYGKPVIFGPRHKKFREAYELITSGGGFAISGYEELKDRMLKLLNDPVALENAGKASYVYVQKNKGATGTILKFIQEKRLLTS